MKLSLKTLKTLKRLAIVAPLMISPALMAQQTVQLSGLTSEGESCAVYVTSQLNDLKNTAPLKMSVSLGTPFEDLSSSTAMTIVSREEGGIRLTTSECNAESAGLYQTGGEDWALTSCESGSSLSRVFVIFKKGTNLPRQISGTSQGSNFSCVSID